MAFACARILSAVGVRRTKLQLLQPIAGVFDSPLFDAWAGWVRALTPIAAPATASAAKAARTGIPRFSDRRIGPPASQRPDATGPGGGSRARPHTRAGTPPCRL